MKLGAEAEDVAVRYLEQHGYRILERNYRNPFGEIDIIALEKGSLVFIEVKARSSDEYGLPFQAVNGRKREKMRNVALMYLKRFRKEVPARFDIVSIVAGGPQWRINLIRNAFEVP